MEGKGITEKKWHRRVGRKGIVRPENVGMKREDQK